MELLLIFFVKSMENILLLVPVLRLNPRLTHRVNYLCWDMKIEKFEIVKMRRKGYKSYIYTVYIY
jgi:hypothetical protein